RQCDQERGTVAIKVHCGNESHGYGHQEQPGENRESVLVGQEGAADPVEQFAQAHFTGGTFVSERDFLHEGVEREQDGRTAPEQAPLAEAFVMRGHVGGDQGEAVTAEGGDYRVRRGKEHLDKILRGLVRRGIHKVHEEHTHTDVNGREADHPAALALLHAAEEEERDERDEDVEPGEFLGGLFYEDAQLHQEAARLDEKVGGARLLELAARNCVNESVHGAGIAPFHGRIGHAGERLVEIETDAQDAEAAHDHHRQKLRQDAPGADRQPDASSQRTPADEVEQHEHAAFGDVRENEAAVGPVPDPHQRVDDEIAEEDVAAGAGTAHGDQDFQADGGDHEALVRGDREPVHEQRPIEEAVLVRGINPAQRQDEHREEERDEENDLFPFAGHSFEVFNSLDEHAAAARDHERQQTAGDSARGGFSHGDTPGDVADGQQYGPEPRVNAPNRIAGRVRNACIKGRGAEFARVFEGYLGGDSDEISYPDNRKRE